MALKSVCIRITWGACENSGCPHFPMFVVQKVWVGTWEYAVITRCQVTLRVLVWEPHFEENFVDLAELCSELNEIILRECLLGNCCINYNLSLSSMK